MQLCYLPDLILPLGILMTEKHLTATNEERIDLFGDRDCTFANRELWGEFISKSKCKERNV